MTHLISMQRVGLVYPGPPPVRALHPIDLDVKPGEYVTVVGPSGSGKSTFLNIAGLLDRPTEGRLAFGEVDVGGLRESQRAALRGRRIGFVFQAFHLLLHRTAVENVALAQLYSGMPRRRRLATSKEALERVGLAHRADAFPTTLSGGERQRVAIARALSSQPRLLLCDEPTGNLDSATANDVLALLDQLHADGLTIILITHDPNVASRAQRTLTIRDGHLYE